MSCDIYTCDTVTKLQNWFSVSVLREITSLVTGGGRNFLRIVSNGGLWNKATRLIGNGCQRLSSEAKWGDLETSFDLFRTNILFAIFLCSSLSSFSLFFSFVFYLSFHWINMAQDRDRWRALVNTVPNLRVTSEAENFLTGWATVSFSRRILFHGVRWIKNAKF
jgi:hypothetical protein